MILEYDKKFFTIPAKEPFLHPAYIIIREGRIPDIETQKTRPDMVLIKEKDCYILFCDTHYKINERYIEGCGTLGLWFDFPILYRGEILTTIEDFYEDEKFIHEIMIDHIIDYGLEPKQIGTVNMLMLPDRYGKPGIEKAYIVITDSGMFICCLSVLWKISDVQEALKNICAYAIRSSFYKI